MSSSRGCLFLLPALLALQLSAGVAASSAAEPGVSELELWPGAAPGSSALALTESVTERSKDPRQQDRFVTGLLRPRLLWIKAEKVRAQAPNPEPSGVALIIAPGGGYVREVLDKEGFETARWLAARGISSFVLLYRLPGEGHQQRADVPLQDAQRAVRLLRGRAREFGIDPRRIGVLGFSAGGHVAASVATRFDAKVYQPVDSLDALSARPDFSILLYAVVSLDPAIAHAGSRQALLGEAPSATEIRQYSAENNVTAATPPTLLILADDDTSVVPANSLRYYEALHRLSVPVELHIYARGKHGFGIRGARGLPVAAWPDVAWSWLSASGFLASPAH